VLLFNTQTFGIVLDAGMTILLWTVLSLYLAGSLYWIYEMVRYGIWYTPPVRQYGARDAQVRILTVNNEKIVRETVRRLPNSFDDRHVIAEEPMDVPGATVWVVPDGFESEATNKGRALEWARQSIPCDREFLFYLDEDSHITQFGGFPDADIVQFNEFPRRTGSLLTFFCEINRIGFQVEQRAFPRLKIPLYAWGGGLAIRTSIEDAVTWDYATIIEDTAFLWRSFTELDREISLAFVPDRVSNQAPPSIRSMFRQRRRWIAGSRENNDLLSLDRILIYGIRDLSWSATGIIPVLAVASLLPGVDILFSRSYRVISFILLGFMFVWIVIGILRYRPTARLAVATVVLAPFTTVLHSIGALWGIISVPDTFEVTAKVDENSKSDKSNAEQTDREPNIDWQ
jgi:hypothetical protein